MPYVHISGFPVWAPCPLQTVSCSAGTPARSGFQQLGFGGIGGSGCEQLPLGG
uniref:Uncharacterized protein n=1 Tax=Arundo donax TaxID=35708 RepID=A0A0A9B7Z5_ARUDO